MRAILAALFLCLAVSVSVSAQPPGSAAGSHNVRVAQQISAPDVLRAMRCAPPFGCKALRPKWVKPGNATRWPRKHGHAGGAGLSCNAVPRVDAARLQRNCHGDEARTQTRRA